MAQATIGYGAKWLSVKVACWLYRTVLFAAPILRLAQIMMTLKRSNRALGGEKAIPRPLSELQKPCIVLELFVILRQIRSINKIPSGVNTTLDTFLANTSGFIWYN